MDGRPRPNVICLAIDTDQRDPKGVLGPIFHGDQTNNKIAKRTQSEIDQTDLSSIPRIETDRNQLPRMV
jgi:hypothetical protein